MGKPWVESLLMINTYPLVTYPLVIVQSRLTSTRCPGKVMMDLSPGRTMLSHVVKRARGIAATTVAHAESFPDLDENDVLSRYVRVVSFTPLADPIIRVTGDCPLLDTGLGLGILARYYLTGAPYVGTSPEYDGLDVEVFSRTLLLEADNVTPKAAREHVTPWMKFHPSAVEVSLMGPSIHWSVNTMDDVAFVREVFKACEHCREGVPRHTNSLTSIGGGDRHPVWELHHLDRGDLAECTAFDILKGRMGP